MCDKCKKHKAVIEYKGSKYCTWYCGKKKLKKDLTCMAFYSYIWSK